MSAVVVVIIIIAVLIVLVLLLGTRRSEQLTLSFDEPVRRAEARLRAGAVSFVPTDGPARVHRTVRWALTRPDTSERVEEGVLRIEAGPPWRGLLGSDITYRVEIPEGASVLAATGAGSIAVQGLSGDVEVLTSAGRVALAGLSGRVRAVTQAGQVQGTGLAAREVDVQSNAGALSLVFEAVPDRVRARTNAGRVELSVPDERYAVDANSSAGATRIDIASDPTAPRRLVAHSNAGAVWVRRA